MGTPNWWGYGIRSPFLVLDCTCCSQHAPRARQGEPNGEYLGLVPLDLSEVVWMSYCCEMAWLAFFATCSLNPFLPSFSPPPSFSTTLPVVLFCQFSLIAGLIRYLFSKTEINVLILGLDYAGKTVSSLSLPCVFVVEYIPPRYSRMYDGEYRTACCALGGLFPKLVVTCSTNLAPRSATAVVCMVVRYVRVAAAASSWGRITSAFASLGSVSIHCCSQPVV